jgi:hypothetical protein
MKTTILEQSIYDIFKSVDLSHTKDTLHLFKWSERSKMYAFSDRLRDSRGRPLSTPLLVIE